MRIRTIKHKGLKRFCERGTVRGLPADVVEKVQVILTVLETAMDISEVGGYPGWRLHQLTGDRKGQWSITVTRNWRMVFKIDGDEVKDLDFEDYH